MRLSRRILAVPAVAAGLAIPLLLALPLLEGQSATEAPAAFGPDNELQSNGFVSAAQFELDRAAFETSFARDQGLGPVYNAPACADCHANPVTGASSQVSNLRAGNTIGAVFVEHPGGSLIQDRAIDPKFQERILAGNATRTFRAAPNLLGAGFVECIASDTLATIARLQPVSVRGTLVSVPVNEGPAAGRRTGRFGWKDQQASLLSFSGEMFRDQIGITSPLFPVDSTRNGLVVDDGVPDPEDPATRAAPFGAAVEASARFLRATGVFPRDPALASLPDARLGQLFFALIGCATCHVPTIQTAPPGTAINVGAFVVPEALGDKIIHPYGDFLLHDVGTGDGIVQNGGQATRNLVRTAALWGVRARPRLMHDGLSLTRDEAILRHGGQAAIVRASYLALSSVNRARLLLFLGSL